RQVARSDGYAKGMLRNLHDSRARSYAVFDALGFNAQAEPFRSSSSIGPARNDLEHREDPLERLSFLSFRYGSVSTYAVAIDSPRNAAASAAAARNAPNGRCDWSDRPFATVRKMPKAAPPTLARKRTTKI